jgi:hypothetical protein
MPPKVLTAPPATMLNGVVMFGGEIVSGTGGYIMVAPTPCDVEGFIYYTRRLDVCRWIGRFTYRDAEVTHSGLSGGQDFRRIGYNWVVRIEVAYDVTNPPETVLSNKTGVGLILCLGDPAQYKHLPKGQSDPDGQPDPAFVKRYALPSALLSEVETINDARATDVVRQTALLKGTSPFFLLPNEKVDYDAYIKTMEDQGWIEKDPEVLDQLRKDPTTGRK